MDLSDVDEHIELRSALRRGRPVAGDAKVARWTLRRETMQSGWVELSAEEWRSYFKLSRLSWSVTGFVLFLVAATILATSLRLSGSRVPINAIVPALSALVFLFYVHIRKDPLIIILSNGFAALFAFAYIDAMFSYVATFWGAAFPLVDASLARADLLLGLDWAAFLKWMNAHPLLAQGLDIAYRSLFAQSIAIVLVLAVAGQHRLLQLFILAMQIAALATCVIAATLPAVGAYAFYQIGAADHQAITLATTNGHVAAVLNLRGPAPLLPFEEFDGIITFPSFHAAAAALFAWAFWPIRGLRWAMLALNVGMVAATPLSGAHYFADVLAGLVIAWIAIRFAMTIARRIEIGMDKSAHAIPVGAGGAPAAPNALTPSAGCNPT